MTSTAHRFVVALSARDRDRVIAQAAALADYLDGSRNNRRRTAFADAVTLSAVVKTLLLCREPRGHRVAFTTESITDTVTRLRSIVAESAAGKRLQNRGIHVNFLEAEPFSEELAEDHSYLLQLLSAGRYDRVAALWTVGFPVDWKVVHPELDDELPIYLPRERLSRQRFWPHDPSTPRPSETTATPTPARAPGHTIVATTAPTSRPDGTGPSADSAPMAETFASMTDSTFARTLASLPSTVRRQRLRCALQKWIAETLAYSAGELPAVDSGFFDIGMTSIHLQQVQAVVIETLGFEPSVQSGFDYPTIAEFADYLESSIDFAAAASHVTDEPTTGRSAVRAAEPVAGSAAVPADSAVDLLASLDPDAIDQLSAVELERVLARIL